MASAFQRIYSTRLYEFFIQWHQEPRIYEMFLDNQGECFIGTFDTKAQAKAYAVRYAETAGAM